jgi:hypothetical protein
VIIEEKPHRKLKVWQASMDFVIEIYNEVQHFPVHEKFGMVTQLQRAAVSIPSNIAEGAARRNTRELLQFLYIARGIGHTTGNLFSSQVLGKAGL